MTSEDIAALSDRIAAWIIGLAIVIVWVAVGYVALHFIIKFW